MNDKIKLILGLFSPLVAIFFGTWLGDIEVSISSLFKIVFNHLFFQDYYSVDKISDGVIWHYRLSRTIFAGLCGAVLACCGAVLQSILKNNLADPYILGVASGASTGVVFVILLGLGGGIIGLSLGAFLGAVLSFLVVLMVGTLIRNYSGGFGISLILAGIAVAQFFNALTSLIITMSANSDQARGIMFWLLGSFSGVNWSVVAYAIPISFFTFIIMYLSSRVLDSFVFGDEYASSLGLKIKHITIALVLVTSFSTGYFISVVGAVGFVGLIVPHISRMIIGPKHSSLLPVCFLVGFNFMILAEIFSRLLVHQQVIPIGVITALVGAPVFIIIMLRNNKKCLN